MKIDNLKTGDLVKLKSGGPTMCMTYLVEGFEGFVRCCYFDSHNCYHIESFNKECLYVLNNENLD